MTHAAMPAENQESRVREFVTAYQSLRREVQKVIVGHDDVIDHVLVGLSAGGHVLLEGVPGLGKTLLIRTLGRGGRGSPRSHTRPHVIRR